MIIIYKVREYKNDRKRTGSIKNAIYKAILEGFFNCEFTPNQVINEKDLIDKFGCSNSPVREALVALCNDNVLRSIPRYGYEVVRLSRQDIDEMPEFRYLIEGGMIPANLDNINAKQIKQLELLNETCSISNDVWSHWESNVNSHLQLMAFCRNEFAYLELRRAEPPENRLHAVLPEQM